MSSCYTGTNQIIHELTMLYLQNQDLSGKTPAEIHDMYQAAFAEIKKKRENR